MILDGLLVLSGLALLVFGGEALVRGASGIAALARVSHAVIGLTIVAAGTSAPELVVSVQAALQGSPGLAVGNVVGSNIFNIGAIVGLAALVRPLRIRGNTVRLEWPVMMLAALQLHLLSRDGSLDRLEGGFLVGALVAFVAYSVWLGRHATTAVEQAEFEDVATASFGQVGAAAVASNVAVVLVGIGLLAGGSTALVHGAVGVAGALGISDTVVGLTIVAGGTSTPELVTSIVAAHRGRDDIAIANVVGSNIFNVLLILGAVALIEPVPVPSEIYERDNWFMIGASLLLFPIMKSGMRLNRFEGVLLIAALAAYWVFLSRAGRAAALGYL